jgi:hypothetical protein
MSSERRIINKHTQKAPIAGAENIMVKPKGMEERMREVEAYLQQIDPILRTAVTDINGIKGMVTSLNEELTKMAGVQARTNNYLDGKLAEINATFGAIVTVVKKIDDDYQALFSEEGEEQVVDDGVPGPDQPADDSGEYTDDDLFEPDESGEQPESNAEDPLPDLKPIAKVEKPVPKQPDKKKK